MFISSAELATEVPNSIVIIQGYAFQKLIQLFESVTDLRRIGFMGFCVGLVELVQYGLTIAIIGIKGVGIVLLGSGLRIGECTGLVWRDCDFKRNTISVHRTLIYRKWEDGMCYYRVMPVPKTVKGIRKIPMFKEVREALLAEQKHQEEVGTANTIIDGVGNWVFTNRYGTVLSPKSVNNAIERIIRDYNRMEEVLAKEQGRVPQLLPHITNHQLRHSFCTRLMEESCKPGSNIPLKLIQDIMGHADFSTTMDIYTDVSEKFKQDTMQAIQGSIYLG